jgi:hypothetical protein
LESSRELEKITRSCRWKLQTKLVME